MPAAFLRELARCQDSLPAPPWSETVATIESELGRPLGSVFSSVDEKPLAVASIASVHRAVLLDGRQVVVKVQHSRIRGRLLQDLKCLETIGAVVRWLDADFDFTPVVREWAREVPKELDFVCEAANTKRVAANLAPYALRPPGDGLAIHVRLADVIPGLTSEKLMVMSYVDGFKVNDVAKLSFHGVDKAAAMTQVTRAYAQQIFGDGFYSGDPHPGNILLDVAKGNMPVLLDFGLTKELSVAEKHHFAKLIVSAAEGDIHGLLLSLEGVGLRLRPDVPFDVALLGKYFFRDANPSGEAKKENAERRAQWRAEAEAKKRTLYVGDKVTVTSSFLGWKTAKNGEVLRVVPTGDGGAPSLVVRLTDGAEVCAPLPSCKLQTGRSPIDAWPDAFIFFERVLNLLRGLTASLDVKQSYLEIMTPYARLALRAAPLSSAACHGIDALGVARLLDAAVGGGEALGVQVSVRRNGSPIVELSAGACDPYECIPVAHSTRFCAFSVTKAVASACVYSLVSDGRLDLSLPVASYWPAFGANGKERITVADVLAHKAGLQDVGGSELATDPLAACDSVRMIYLVAAAAPDPSTLGRTAYHYLSFGWILDGLVRSVAHVPLQDFARTTFAEPLGIAAEFGIGVPHETDIGGGALATLVLQKRPEPSPALPARAARPPVAAAAAAAASAKNDAAGGKAAEPKRAHGGATVQAGAGSRPPASPSLMQNPTYFNKQEVREASLPSANGHFSARALTSFYHELTVRGLASNLIALRGAAAAGGEAGAAGGAAAAADAMLQGEERSFLSGFVLYDSPAETNGTVVFGHSGLGGSVALVRFDPSTGDSLSIALTLNRMSFDSALTRRVMRTVFEQVKLPVPTAFVAA